VTQRNPVVVVILSALTLSIYAFYWLFVTTEELKKSTGDERLDPMVDLLLSVVTFGLWGVYAAWRNAGIVHGELRERGVEHEDRSLLIAGFGAATYFVGFSWLVGMALLQEDFNALARTETASALGAGDAPLPVTY